MSYIREFNFLNDIDPDNELFNQDILNNINDDGPIDIIDLELQETELLGVPPKSKQLKRLTGSIMGHLALPINESDPEFLLKYDSFFCYRHTRLKAFITNGGYNTIISKSCKNPYRCIKNWILNSSNTEGYLRSSLFESILKSAIHSYHLNHTIVLNSYRDNSINNKILNDQFLNKLDKLIPILINELVKDYSNMLKVEVIKDNICNKDIDLGKIMKYQDLFYEKDIVFFTCHIHKTKVLCPMTLFICVLDKIQSRFTLKLYWMLCDSFDKYTSSIYKKGCKMIKILESYMDIIGQDFFKVVALLEPLMVGFVTADPADLNFTDLYDSVCFEINSILEPYDISFNYKEFLPFERTDDSIHMHLELTGIAKIFGHPILEPEKLLNQLREHAVSDPDINSSLVTKAVGLWTRDFSIRYLSKHKRYPRAKLVPIELKKMWEKNKNPTPSERINYVSWSMIQFDKTFDYDYSPDTSELLKDTSIAPPRENWMDSYDFCAFKNLYDKPKPRAPTRFTKKRVMEMYLEGNENDVYLKIQRVESRYKELTDSIAVLCGKEGELKTESGRAFTKQTFYQRLYQTSIEKNLSNHVFPFVFEQTMTDNDLILQQRIEDNVREQSKGAEVLTLDLTKWNLRFRHLLVYPFGEKIDQLFGLKNLYTYNHLWFVSNLLVLTNNRLTPPDYDSQNNPIRGPYCHLDHRGGMEGMRQKMWTMITISIIKLAAEVLGLEISILAQGDNQVVLIKYNDSQRKDTGFYRTQLLNTLNDYFDSVNLSLKLKETWFSRHLHEYGKERHYKGVKVSSGTKKSSKFVPDQSESVATFMSYLSTINTMTEGIARCDTNAGPAFIINQFHVLNYLSRRKVITKGNELTHLLALNFPSDFGGMTLSHYISHLVRGHDDKVTLWLYNYLAYRSLHPTLYKHLLSLCVFEPTEKDKQFPPYARLFEDIFTLNIKPIPTIETKMSDIVLDYLRSSKVTNPEIRRLYEGQQSLKQDELVHILTTMKPCFVQLGHELLTLSNAGILINLRNKLTSVQTIRKIVQDSEKISFLRFVEINTEKVKTILINKIKKSLSSYKHSYDIIDKANCPTDLAQYLRKTGWKLDIIGVTKPNPLDQIKIINYDSSSDSIKANSIVIELSDEISTAPNSYKYSRGPFTPYLGGITKEKIKKPSLEIVNKTTYIKAIQRLVLIRSWIIRLNATNLKDLIDSLILEKGLEGLDQNYLVGEYGVESWCTINWGGTMFHRFKANIEKDAAMSNTSPTLHSHFAQTTNGMKSLTMGGKDHTVFFQLIFLINVIIINHLTQIESYAGKKFLLCNFSCHLCTQEITGVTFDIKEMRRSMPNTPLIHNAETLCVDPLLSINELQCLLSIHLGLEFGKNIDENYLRLHSRNDPSLRNEFTKSELISINDLRHVDFDIFTIHVILGSDHICKMVGNYSLPLLSMTRNRSLTTLAQYMLNADLLSIMAQRIPSIATEHSELINPQAISSYIFKCYLIFILNRYPYIIQKCHKIYLINAELEKKLIYNLKRVIYYINYNFENVNLINRKVLTKRMKAAQELSEINLKQFLPIAQKFFNYLTSTQIQFEPRGLELTQNEIMFYWRTYGIHQHKVLNQIIHHETVFSNLSSAIDLTFYSDYYDSMSVQVAGDLTLTHISHTCRPFGSISSAASKYIEILNMFKTSLYYPGSDNLIVCLAEGSGGVLATLLKLFPMCQGAYNTLRSDKIDIRTNPLQNYPPAVLSEGWFYKVKFSDELMCGETNILKEDFKRKLKYVLSSNPPYIITMDAESPNHGTNLEFCEFLFSFCLSFDPAIVIFKIFIPELGLPPFIHFCHMIQQYHRKYFITMVKPVSSNPNITECFLVGINTIKLNRVNVNELEIYHRSVIRNVNFGALRLVTSRESIEKYLSYSSQLMGIYKIQPIYKARKVHITELYSSTFTRSCGIWCLNNVQNILLAIDTAHLSERNDLANLIVREMGTNNFICEKLQDVFLILLARYFEGRPIDFIEGTYNFLVTKKIGEERKHNHQQRRFIRVRGYCPDEEVSDYTNIKTMYRNILNYQKCNCTIEKKSPIILSKVKDYLSFSLLTEMEIYLLAPSDFHKKFFIVKD